MKVLLFLVALSSLAACSSTEEKGVVIYFEKVPTTNEEAKQYKKVVKDVSKVEFENKYSSFEMRKWISTTEFNSPDFQARMEECNGSPCPCKMPQCICGPAGSSTANQCW